MRRGSNGDGQLLQKANLVLAKLAFLDIPVHSANVAKTLRIFR